MQTVSRWGGRVKAVLAVSLLVGVLGSCQVSGSPPPPVAEETSAAAPERTPDPVEPAADDAPQGARANSPQSILPPDFSAAGSSATDAFGGSAGTSPLPPPPPSPAPHRAPPKAARPSSGLPSFPWPPPQPSARELIPRGQLLGAATQVSQGEVARRIEAALRQAGYTEYSYYAAPGGFALVARLERMRADGTPEPGEFRFLAPNVDAPFSLSTYISQLFFAPEGFYRQIVFVATDQAFVASAPAPTAQEAERLLQGGGNILPEAYNRRAFTPGHNVTALIYEFKKNPADRDVETLRPGRLAGAQHLAKAGIRFGGAP